MPPTKPSPARISRDARPPSPPSSDRSLGGSSGWQNNTALVDWCNPKRPGLDRYIDILLGSPAKMMSRRTENRYGASYNRQERNRSPRSGGFAVFTRDASICEAGTASYILAPSSSIVTPRPGNAIEARPCDASLRPQSIVATKGRWGTIADSGGSRKPAGGQAGARI